MNTAFVDYKDKIAHRYKNLWRSEKGVLPNTLALSYVFVGHILGMALLTQASWVLFLIGIIFTAHTLVISAYMVHESAHMTLFKSKSLNEKAGEVFLWIVGAAYASFNRVRHMHLRHHQDRADVGCFDYQAFLKQRPKWFQKIVYGLEWAYFPAIELIMHFQVIIRPFREQKLYKYRRRVILIALSRFSLFILLFIVSPWALLGYAIAYLIMIQVLFLADAFAHTYDAFYVENPDDAVTRNGRDKAYDIKHTYSNLISKRFPVLNLLNLNFGYHTAHHVKASVAWHELPEFHAKQFGNVEHQQVLPFSELLRTTHRNRLKRILVKDYGDVGQGPNRADSFIGAHGVSFLTIV